MRLSTFEFKGRRRIGAVVDDRMVDLAAAHAALIQSKGGDPGQALPNDMIGLLELGEAGLAAVRAAVDYAMDKREDRRDLSYGLAEIQLKAPIPRPGKVIMTGLNYASHISEARMPKSQYPWTSVKFSSTVIGPGEPIRRHPLTTRLDGEVELAFVIGRRGKYVSEDDAMDYVVGYTIINDVSARDIQFRGDNPQYHFTLGKNADTFSPLGPYLVTPDEISDVYDLEIEHRVNGQVMQHANTSQLVFSISRLVSFFSQYFTLEPGDVASTGTCQFLVGRESRRMWEPGDLVEIEIGQLGILANPVIADEEGSGATL